MQIMGVLDPQEEKWRIFHSIYSFDGVKVVMLMSWEKADTKEVCLEQCCIDQWKDLYRWIKWISTRSVTDVLIGADVELKCLCKVLIFFFWDTVAATYFVCDDNVLHLLMTPSSHIQLNCESCDFKSLSCCCVFGCLTNLNGVEQPNRFFSELWTEVVKSLLLSMLIGPLTISLYLQNASYGLLQRLALA